MRTGASSTRNYNPVSQEVDCPTKKSKCSTLFLTIAYAVRNAVKAAFFLLLLSSPTLATAQKPPIIVPKFIPSPPPKFIPPPGFIRPPSYKPKDDK